MRFAAQAFEQGDLQVRNFEHPNAWVGLLCDAGQVTAQEREREICRDSEPLRDAVLGELLDRAAGDDNWQSRERVPPLMKLNRLRQRPKQIFKAIRVVELEHRRIRRAGTARDGSALAENLFAVSTRRG